MNISQITGVYFSPTGGTKRVTEWITERIADNRRQNGWISPMPCPPGRIIHLQSMSWW